MPNPSKLRRERRIRIHKRIRLRLRGDASKPRLCVSFSGKNIYAQVIDDAAGKTLAAVSTLEETLKKGIRANVAGAAQMGKEVATRASKKEFPLWCLTVAAFCIMERSKPLLRRLGKLV